MKMEEHDPLDKQGLVGGVNENGKWWRSTLLTLRGSNYRHELSTHGNALCDQLQQVNGSSLWPELTDCVCVGGGGLY